MNDELLLDRVSRLGNRLSKICGDGENEAVVVVNALACVLAHVSVAAHVPVEEVYGILDHSLAFVRNRQAGSLFETKSTPRQETN